MASMEALARQLADKVYELLQGFEGRENTPEAQAEMVDALAKVLPSVPLAPIEVELADPKTRPHDSPGISFKVTLPPWMARKLREDLLANE